MLLTTNPRDGGLFIRVDHPDQSISVLEYDLEEGWTLGPVVDELVALTQIDGQHSFAGRSYRSRPKAVQDSSKGAGLWNFYATFFCIATKDTLSKLKD